MSIHVEKRDGGYVANVDIPQANLYWKSDCVMSREELIDAFNRLGVHLQDMWDAIMEAEASGK